MRNLVYKIIDPSEPIPVGHIRTMMSDELAKKMNKNHNDTLNMIQELNALLENKALLEE